MLSPLPTWVQEKTGLGSSLSPRTLEQWQFARLREQLNYAREHSPYYADQLQNLDISSIRGRSDLPMLPFTPAQALRAEPRRLLCISHSQTARVTTLNTSGSSGDTKRVWFSAADLRRSIEFFARGLSALVKPGQRALVLLSDDKPDSLGDLLRRAFCDLEVYPLLHGYMRDTAAAAEAAAGAHCLIGLPAQINRLCLSAPYLTPKTVLLTADHVPQSIVDKIESIWGCAVFTHYGLTESGFGLAVQCAAREAQHLRDAEFIVEIIDPATGQVVPDGQWGEAALTSLVNEAMPLIRYRTGDLTRRMAAPCACGGCLPRLDKVRARVADFTQPFPISVLDEALFCLPALVDYTAELLPAGGLVLTIDSLTTYEVTTVRQALARQGLFPPTLILRQQSLPLYSGPAKRQVKRPIPEDRSQKSEVRRQRTEVRSQKSEVRRQRLEDRGQKTEVRRQRSKDDG